MTLQTDRQRDTETTHQHTSGRAPNRYMWLFAVLLAMAVAGIVGVAVTAHLTGPATTKTTVYHEPNPNTREGRVPASIDPNANTREDRGPASVDPNANTREDRVSGNG